MDEDPDVSLGGESEASLDEGSTYKEEEQLLENQGGSNEEEQKASISV